MKMGNNKCIGGRIMQNERKEFVEGFMAAVCLFALRKEGKCFSGDRRTQESPARKAEAPVAGRVVLENYLDIPTYLRRGRSIRV